MALVPTLAPDPGADIAAQAQLLRQQKLAELLANPPEVVKVESNAGGGGGGGGGNSPEGNFILAKMLSEDVGKTAGPSVAAFDAPASSPASFVAPSSQSSSPVHLGNVNMAERIYNSLRSNGASHAEAIMLTGAANSESSFNPRAIHDGGIGYGMFGHNGRRLAAMRSQFGPNPTAEQQALFALQEARQRGDIPSGATPEQIAAAQMSFERPRGWRPGHPELGDNYGGRLNTIRAYLNRFGGGGSPAPAANPVASAPMAAAPEATPAPYKVASLGYTPVPHRQPIAPMQPAPQPAPAPTATPPVPPIPTMVGAPLPTTSTPISPTAGASLTDAPLPPSRSASGVDDMIKRQAAAARPALNEPEGFDLFDEIGRGLEELFGGGGDTGGGGPSPQQLGTQLASAGEEYYPMPPSNSHGILGLISDAFREPVPIPQEVRALANSPKQSDRLAYQLMVHGDQLGGTQSSMLTALYKEAREREQAGENRFGAPRMDEYGNLVQEGPNGQLHILRAAEKPVQQYSQPHMDSAGNFVQEGPDGQVHILRAAEKPPAPISVGEGTTLYDPTTRQPIYTAPKAPPSIKDDPYESTRAKDRAEMDALEEKANRLGLQGDERRQFLISGGKSLTQDEKTTSEQNNSALFATRMREADKIISDPSSVEQTKGFWGAAQAIEGGLPVIGNFLVSDDYQRLTQAQLDFLTATLRKESGASINPSEYENAKKQYFPQPGDSQSVLAQKLRNRQIAIEGVAAGGPPGFRQSFFGERNPNISERAGGRSSVQPSSGASQNTSKPTQIFEWLPDGTLKK